VAVIGQAGGAVTTTGKQIPVACSGLGCRLDTALAFGAVRATVPVSDQQLSGPVCQPVQV
jgi:hypothetical protein